MADLTNVPWDEFPMDAGANDQVSANFQFYELTKSETADRHLIDNSFREGEHVHCAVWLCRNLMQRVRDAFGPYTPNSVYRSQALERALKNQPESWTSTSQHTRGQACDIEIPGMSTMALARWMTENLEFDQVICECYNPAKGANSGWVHISLLPPGMGENRREVLSYIMDPARDRYVYVPGLRESVV